MAQTPRSSGEFHLLLHGSQSSGFPTMRGISLVEQDVQVGDTTLTAGSFLLARGTSVFDIHHFTADGVGAGTATNGTVSMYIDGSDIGMSSYVQGIEVIEQETTIGGTTLAAGNILVTTSADILGFTDQDIFYLGVSKTEFDQSTTVATATLFLDGSDVALDSNAEDVSGLTLVPAENQAPTDLSTGIELNNDGGNDAYLVTSDAGVMLGGLTSFTMDFQFSIDQITNFNPLISYATAAQQNAFLLMFVDDGTTSVLLNGVPSLSLSGMDYRDLMDGELHSLSFAWDSTNGDWIHIGEPASPLPISPTCGPPAWEDTALELDPGDESLAQPEPEFAFDQRV